MKESNNTIRQWTEKTSTGKVEIIQLNRPDRMNAMNGELVEELGRVFSELQGQRETRVVILCAAGERAFCVGADLKERKTMSDDEVRDRILAYKHTFGAIANLDKPVICAINGYAFGGGLEIALACDFRVASENAIMGLTETRLGIIPGAGGTQRLSRLIGVNQAKELIFGGVKMTAEEAKNKGVVNRVSTVENLMETCLNWAIDLAKSAPIALAQAKRAIDGGFEMTLDQAIDFEAQCYAQVIPTKDRLEGIHAFAEGRPPQWEGQ